MGLDGTIRKAPEDATKEVKYWRKNWVLQNWMDSENCEIKSINKYTMNKLLKFIDDENNRDSEASEEWTKEDWNDFRKSIEYVLDDMKSNSTYIYTYDGWW